MAEKMGVDKVKEYEKLAVDHADFLCEKVFKPAFILGFVHGGNHMFKELTEVEEQNHD